MEHRQNSAVFRWVVVGVFLFLCLMGASCSKRNSDKEDAGNNSRDGKPTRSLPRAAFHGDIREVQLHISTGTDINVRDEGGSTALHWAAGTGYRDIVELLVANGADVNAKDNSGTTPLQAAASGKRDIVEFLIAKGSDVNAKGHLGWTALHFSRRPEVAELLIAKGAHVNAPDENGLLPIHVAAKEDRRTIVERDCCNWQSQDLISCQTSENLGYSGS